VTEGLSVEGDRLVSVNGFERHCIDIPIDDSAVLSIPQSAVLTAPFAQGSIFVVCYKISLFFC